MTRAEAERVQPGQFVFHPSSGIPFEPLLVKAVASSLAGRPMARLEVCGQRWLPLTEYGLPKKGWKWERHLRRWIDAKGRDVELSELRAMLPQLDLLESAS